MQDPIGSFLRIRELYMSYLDTAFRIGDESIAAERGSLLRTPGSMCTEPLVEPLPRYEPHTAEFHEFLDQGGADDPLPGFADAERKAFLELVLAGLFPSEEATPEDGVRTSRKGFFAPYSHQVEMLRRGSRAESPGIVTSGTGSGKTEAFLLPILAALSKEAKTWPAPEHGYLGKRWWHDSSTGQPHEKYEAIPLERRPTESFPRRMPVESHRSGENRDAAVRALVLYPMNALVEDQLVRLRKSLDSREARSVMDREFDGNRLFFGRYTGKTPVTGHADHPGLRKILDLHKDDPSLSTTVHAPSHKRADDSGMVSLGDIRKSEVGRRQRKQKELFAEMVALEKGQRDARHYASADSGANADMAASSVEDDAPFMFPSVDGSELVSRWDMQATPPDILVTNVSMLGAMLTREVDEPIFSRTREWLEKPDSYFYLVLDELHLQRGSAGTEVSYLLRLLFDRLGLSREGQRHKLRILASSASLPSHPEDRAESSADYLWDMFGRFGVSKDLTSDVEGKKAWVDSIVPGREILPDESRPEEMKLHTKPYVELLRRSRNQVGSETSIELAETATAVDPAIDPEVERYWRDIAADLGIVHEDFDLHEVMKHSVRGASHALSFACWRKGEGRTRATGIREIAKFLFEDLREVGDHGYSYDDALEAVRALMFVRGCGDGLEEYLGGKVEDAVSFRLHTFFRSIEGLYAPACKNAGIESSDGDVERTSEVGRLSIERETRKEFDIPGVGPRLLRQFELLYCECCGGLFFGGMRSGGQGGKGFKTELLPYEPLIDALPDAASSQRFEELSFERYAIFWPNEGNECDQGRDSEKNRGKWIPAWLERDTGVVRKRGGRVAGGATEDSVKGYLYERETGADFHGRGIKSPESHVPFACPACGTDYSWRKPGLGRPSPVRNFRAGFAKTTQLLATELFDAQRVANIAEDAKLVSFSDSRQDAARAALDIERNHHQDLRRELLITNLHEALGTRRNPEIVQREIEEAKAEVTRAVDSPEEGALEHATTRLNELRRELGDLEEPSVPLASILENPNTWDSSGERMKVRSLLSDLVSRGVHPCDDAGIERLRGGTDDNKDRWYDWTDLFEKSNGEVFYDDSPSVPQNHLGVPLYRARNNLVYSFYQIMSDVLFSKTYFSLEESGLGYIALPSNILPESEDREGDLERMAALLRVIADSYRYRPSPYRDQGEDPPPWVDYGDVRTARVKRFAQAVWKEEHRTEFERALKLLSKAGHADGIIDMPQIRVRLVGEDDLYWRCGSCSRVHLHLGGGVCTRCCTPLAKEPYGLVGELREQSFLARRVGRALEHERSADEIESTFRLHCEELTGQTEDPARRQREFRGIFVPEIRDSDPEDEVAETGVTQDLEHAAREDEETDGSQELMVAKDTIDLLAVTTTMEVGIDVGPLQTILQANMPPQRFNYQQRVGRAGRRGQAFSMALTICRTKSHDIHYFRNPETITGDTPPTPFLTKGMSDIALRFLRKKWLIDAFALLRAEDRKGAVGIYPGDVMSPPDIHGEFVRADTYGGEGSEWPARLRRALDATKELAVGFMDLLTIDGKLEEDLKVDVDSLLGLLDARLERRVAQGLAHSLAELGFLPMYGMPTRVRDLYLRIRTEDRKPVLSKIDRDLDMAIYEFAPGAKVVRDKHEHLCVGFTPSLGLPEYIPKNKDTSANAFQSGWFGENFRLVQCSTCSAWSTLEDTPNEFRCEACEAFLSVDNARFCVVPNAFRTDLRPSSRKEEFLRGSRHRSIQAEGQLLDFSTWTLGIGGDHAFVTESRVAFGHQARTYRLNRGPHGEDGPMGFDTESGIQRVRWGKGRIEFPHQAIASEAMTGSGIFGFQSEREEDPVWLAAPKTTDSLYLSPSRVNDAVSLHRLPARTEDQAPYDTRRWQGVRAAALSATFMIVDRASRDLDIDPVELDVLEPRPYGTNQRLPILQITDQLVNGAGFCRNLSEPSNGIPKILRMIRSMIGDRGSDPLDHLLAEEHADCEMACYRCLLRYGNQQFHGLLDWRLGLTYIRAMSDPDFLCGLDGNLHHPGLFGWDGMARRLAEEMKHRFGGEVGLFANGRVPGFRLDRSDGKFSPWVLVAHPLWDWDRVEDTVAGTILSVAEDEALEEGPVDCWDTFNLSRRPVKVREWLNEKEW